MEDIEQALLKLLKSQIWFDDAFSVTYNLEHFAPALFCFLSLDAFRLHFQNQIILSKALKQICQDKGVDTSKLSIKDSEKLLQERHDLVEEAQKLAKDYHFRFTWIHYARNMAEGSMRFITLETIQEAVAEGIGILLQRANEIECDEVLAVRGQKRDAKRKQQSLVNIARKFASAGMCIKTGRNENSKTKSPIFSYEKLCKAMRAVDKNTALQKCGERPKQGDVAMQMGYKGNNPGGQLGNDLRRVQESLRARGHTSHKWSRLCEEILCRN